MSATGIAAALLAAHASAFSLTASPAVVHAHPGQVRIVHVTDSGAKPVRVTASAGPVARVGGRCAVGPAARGVRVSPHAIALRPGETRAVRVHVARGARGDDAVMFTTRAGDAGQARIAASVGTRLVVGGHARPVQCAAVPHAASAGFGGGLLALPAAALASLLAAVAAWRRRRRHRYAGAHRS